MSEESSVDSVHRPYLNGILYLYHHIDPQVSLVDDVPRLLHDWSFPVTNARIVDGTISAIDWALSTPGISLAEFLPELEPSDAALRAYLAAVKDVLGDQE